MPRLTATMCLSLVLACSVDAATPDDAERAAEVDEEDEEQPAAELVAPAPTPVRAMPQARAAFDEITALVSARYVDGGFDEEALWTAAAEGVLAKLIQSSAHPVNQLLSPDELGELEAGVKGRLSGIGVVIEKQGEVLVVRDALKGGPAARAGMIAGDRILGVDGERVAAVDLPTVVGKIRGAKGTKVELFVQRDTEEWTVPVVRDDIEVPSVEARTLADGVGYLRIGAMGQSTAEHLDAALAGLRHDRVASLVIDLRGCPGGWFEAATAVAERFVPAGAELVRVRDRDGHDESITARSAGAWMGTPMVVLVGADTASGAEVIAAALREHANATLVGAPTVGKTTIESIHKLSNGWALKLSEKRFVLADGSKGSVRPDVPIVPTERERAPAMDAIDPSNDPPLATAIELLRGRG
jgi:carboxyl-terminal processing protease